MEYLFETEHLKFRRFEPDDAEAFYRNHSEKEMKQWLSNESYDDIDEALEAIEFYQEYVDHCELPYVLAVVSKDTGELIGDVGANIVDGTEDEVEIGYSICRKCCGKGYATECARAMSDYSQNLFQLSALYGRVMKGNIASCKVLERSGYVFMREEFDAEDDPYGNGMMVYQYKR